MTHAGDGRRAGDGTGRTRRTRKGRARQHAPANPRLAAPVRSTEASPPRPPRVVRRRAPMTWSRPARRRRTSTAWTVLRSAGKLAEPLVLLKDLRPGASLEEIEKRLRTLAAQLNGADSLRRAVIREQAIARLEELGVRSPARLAEAALGGPNPADGLQGRSLELDDPESWPEPVNGVELGEALRRTFQDHLILPRGADIALALWALHTHAHEEAEVSPNLAFNVTSAPVRQDERPHPRRCRRAPATPSVEHHCGGSLPNY